MNDKPIISVKEARKLLGKDARKMTDEEVLETINTLDVMANDALVQARKKQMERDSMDLANLIYDIYQDKKNKKLSRAQAANIYLWANQDFSSNSIYDGPPLNL